MILAENATIGAGIEGDPIRKLFQLYSITGELVMEIDPCGPTGQIAILRSFYPRRLTHEEPDA